MIFLFAEFIAVRGKRGSESAIDCVMGVRTMGSFNAENEIVAGGSDVVEYDIVAGGLDAV